MSVRRSARTLNKPELPQAPALTNGTSSNVANSSKKRARKAEGGNPPTTTSQTSSEMPQSSTAMMPPVTPVKRRRTGADAKRPPMTPTPSGIGLMVDNSTLPFTPQAPRDRLAEPHATNATLVTPRGTQLQSHVETTTTPSRPATAPVSTTATILQDACDHLIAVDSNMKVHVDRHHCKAFSPEGLAEAIDPFSALASGIMGQQVSGAAAKSIKNKFIALFPTEQSPRGFPLPEFVAKTSLPRLREAGLSQRKAEYIQGLAEKFSSGELTAQMLIEGSDAEVHEKLVAVRGLGAWSVEMFMCFGLKRMDVFSTGDLGVQRGMAAYVGRDVKKLKNKGGKWKYMTEKEMLELSAKFAPYRSLFMWYMWRVEDVDTDAIEQIS